MPRFWSIFRRPRMDPRDDSATRAWLAHYREPVRRVDPFVLIAPALEQEAARRAARRTTRPFWARPAIVAPMAAASLLLAVLTTTPAGRPELADDQRAVVAESSPSVVESDGGAGATHTTPSPYAPPAVAGSDLHPSLIPLAHDTCAVASPAPTPSPVPPSPVAPPASTPPRCPQSEPPGR
jgi:hypothetical protein